MSEYPIVRLAWPWALALESLPADRRARLDLAPPDADALAREIDVDGIAFDDMNLETRPYRKTGVTLTGQISGRAERTCVVSLEPLEERFMVEIKRRFLPAAEAERQTRKSRPTPDEESEIAVHLDDDDPPDPVEGDAIDLAFLVAEEILLNLDPHPRKPDAVFAPSGSEIAVKSTDAARNDEERRPDSPFTALSALKHPSEPET